MSDPGLILGLDAGKSTGWAMYNPLLDIARCGTCDLRSCADLGEMLCEFREWLALTIVSARPALVALERPFGRSGFVADLPGLVVGVAHMVAHEHDTPRREYTASAVKKALTGSGRATKQDVIRAVPAFGFRPITDHEADAAAVAVLAWNREAAG